MMAVSAPEQSDVHGKALTLNLEGSIYGTLAEIGAGQEVAHWFLSVGAASGTVAKTISAYDKTVSDEIYGPGTRYVSKERLVAMLDREYKLLLKRLGASCGSAKRFFAFADTVSARNYQGTNQQHGWLGIRFQTEPGGDPSQILLHVNLCDSTGQRQQQAMGILGVNLIYAVFHQRDTIDTFLEGLFEELSMARIEIDVIELNGPAFLGQDTNAWCLALLYRKMAHAVVFGTGGGPVEPSSVLRKRPLLVLRGTSRHPELLDPGLLQSARRRLAGEGVRCERDPVALVEMSIRHVDNAEPAKAEEMLKCIRKLTPHGPAIASDLPETYLLSRYLRRHSKEPVRFVLSIAAAAKVLQERFYRDLPGTLLEGLGKLLGVNVKLYVARMPRPTMAAAMGSPPGDLPVKKSANGFVGLDDLAVSGPVRHLLEYLRAEGRILDLTE
jgi:hypothetical protein